MAKSKIENSKSIKLDTAFQRIQLPSFEECYSSSKPYVKYGDYNNFPEFLQELANRSALHNSIISSKVDYTYANGLELEGEHNLSTELFFNHPNPYEDLNSIYRKCIYDYILYGCFALNVIWSNDCENISEIYHIDASKIRSGKKNDRGIIDSYFFSDNWNKTAPRYKEIKPFRIDNRVGGQLLYFKEYRPGCFYYALPSYVGALNYIMIDQEISNYHLSHLLNGMSPNFMISFTNGVPTEEERIRIKRQLEGEYCGTDNAGRFIITYTDDPEKTPRVENLSADNLGDQFMQLQQQVLQNILSGHKITSPMLVGIKTEGQLGGNTEIQNAFEIFYSTVIKPIQNDIINQFNNILKNTKFWNGNILKPTSSSPVSFTWSENILSNILTVDEQREMIGKEPVETISDDQIK